MKKIFKHLIAFLLTGSLAVATVMCCCIAPAVMEHFHKAITCNHCSAAGHQHSNPATACQNQLTSADIAHGAIITVVHSAQPSFSPFVSNHHEAKLFVRSPLVYPPGGPPSGISRIPLYLRTFNLRI